MSDVKVLAPIPGASDADREAWLADRRQGPTATEIRDLWLGKLSIADLVARKLGRTPEVGDLSHVPVIGWGKTREPIIAAIAEQRYGIRPESRVFHAADEFRFLASPDGVGEDFDGNRVISELKTAGMDVAPGSSSFDAKGYLIQMTWGMRVMNARRCLYGWEYRLDVPGGGFEPGLLQFEWIDYDESLGVELEVLARKFLAALDEAASEEYVAPEVDDELDTLAVNLLRFREAEAEGKRAKEQTWGLLLARLAESGVAASQASSLARVTYTPGEDVPGEVLDAQAAKEADPDLFAEVQALSARWNEHAAKFRKTVTVSGKPKLTVTSVKTKDVE